MKPKALSLALLAAACTPAPAPAGRDAVQTEKDLLALHEQWADARIKGDVAFLEEFYGQELQLNAMDGGMAPRKIDISFLIVKERATTK